MARAIARLIAAIADALRDVERAVAAEIAVGSSGQTRKLEARAGEGRFGVRFCPYRIARAAQDFEACRQ